MMIFYSAWKLARVLRGAAGQDLLDTYQAEREPHTRALVELAIGMGRVVCTLDSDAAAERDAQMLAQRAAGAPGLPRRSRIVQSGWYAKTWASRSRNRIRARPLDT
jgi:2-polyprenyl-6-methoxyphenol hydroxylase-like FAD-dependent oxidoreductase